MNADVILLCGARLNWILHFGIAPRFKKGVKIIQMDCDPLEAHNNVRSDVMLLGDAKAVLKQLTVNVKGHIMEKTSPWWVKLADICAKNS